MAAIASAILCQIAFTRRARSSPDMVGRLAYDVTGDGANGDGASSGVSLT